MSGYFEIFAINAHEIEWRNIKTPFILCWYLFAFTSYTWLWQSVMPWTNSKKSWFNIDFQLSCILLWLFSASMLGWKEIVYKLQTWWEGRPMIEDSYYVLKQDYMHYTSLGITRSVLAKSGPFNFTSYTWLIQTFCVAHYLLSYVASCCHKCHLCLHHSHH